MLFNTDVGASIVLTPGWQDLIRSDGNVVVIPLSTTDPAIMLQSLRTAWGKVDFSGQPGFRVGRLRSPTRTRAHRVRGPSEPNGTMSFDLGGTQPERLGLVVARTANAIDQ